MTKGQELQEKVPSPAPSIPRCSHSWSRWWVGDGSSPDEPAAISLPRLKLKPLSLYSKEDSTTTTFSQFMKKSVLWPLL